MREALPPYLFFHWMLFVEPCDMKGLLIWGVFERLLVGVSHITYKALASIASLSAELKSFRW